MSMPISQSPLPSLVGRAGNDSARQAERSSRHEGSGPFEEGIVTVGQDGTSEVCLRRSVGRLLAWKRSCLRGGKRGDLEQSDLASGRGLARFRESMDFPELPMAEGVWPMVVAGHRTHMSIRENNKLGLWVHIEYLQKVFGREVADVRPAIARVHPGVEGRDVRRIDHDRFFGEIVVHP